MTSTNVASYFAKFMLVLTYTYLHSEELQLLKDRAVLYPSLGMVPSALPRSFWIGGRKICFNFHGTPVFIQNQNQVLVVGVNVHLCVSRIFITQMARVQMYM